MSKRARGMISNKHDTNVIVLRFMRKLIIISRILNDTNNLKAIWILFLLNENVLLLSISNLSSNKNIEDNTKEMTNHGAKKLSLMRRTTETIRKK